MDRQRWHPSVTDSRQTAGGGGQLGHWPCCSLAGPQGLGSWDRERRVWVAAGRAACGTSEEQTGWESKGLCPPALLPRGQLKTQWLGGG